MKRTILLLILSFLLFLPFSANVSAFGAVTAYTCRTTSVDMGTVAGTWREGETKKGPYVLSMMLPDPEVNGCISAFTCEVPDGETGRILYRGIYEKYRVVETRFPGRTISIHDEFRFQNWDFSYESF